MNEKAQDLFTRALELPESEREVFLARTCGEDAELHLEVQRMLVDAARADAFFGDEDGATLGAEEFKDSYSEKEGDIIGPYKLRQAIGEGGFGTVWMAEQSVPISRMVALKVIKAGMDTKQVLARFEAERQALAMMDHPNIAKVLDAGATATGRPYFAMELVRGIPITRYCDEAQLSTRERLDLFTQICHVRGDSPFMKKNFDTGRCFAYRRPMRKPRSFHLGEPGFGHCYHVVSRVAGREILFGDEESSGAR